MDSSSTTTTKTKVFFKTNMASRVFPCLLTSTQPLPQSPSIAKRSSTTAENSSATTFQSQQSSSTESRHNVQSKHGHGKKQLDISSNVSVDQLNDLLDKHVIDTQPADIVVTDNKADESDEYEEMPVRLPSSVSSPSVKRAFKGSSSKISTSTKRSKNNVKENVDLDTTDDDKNSDDESLPSFRKDVMMKLKQAEIDGRYNRQMFEQLLLHHQRHEATQKLILENQKRLKKALLKKKIYVDIHEEVDPVEKSRTDADGNSYPTELIYSTDGGITTFDALNIAGDPTKKNLFALKLVDELFSEEELIELDPLTKKNELFSHPSYLFIKEAVRVKFRLSTRKMEIEWPNIHEAILNKRRNWKKDKRSKTAGGVTNE